MFSEFTFSLNLHVLTFCILQLYIQILKSHWQKFPQFYVHFHLRSLQLTSVMTGPAKLTDKTCNASVATMGVP